MKTEICYTIIVAKLDDFKKCIVFLLYKNLITFYTERAQGYTLQDASFMRQRSTLVFLFERVRKHTSYARGDKRPPPEYAMTSRSETKYSEHVSSIGKKTFSSCVFYKLY